MSDQHFEITPTKGNDEKQKGDIENSVSIDIQSERKEKYKVGKYLIYFFGLEEKGTTIQAELYTSVSSIMSHVSSNSFNWSICRL